MACITEKVSLNFASIYFVIFTQMAYFHESLISELINESGSNTVLESISDNHTKLSFCLTFIKHLITVVLID